MSERAAYSRVYWSVVDDPKFVTIYDDDHHFAAWTRLLLIADQSHPASAHLPTNVRRASVRALSEAGLLDLQPGSRYRIHGLDAERGRRREAATHRAPAPGPFASRLVPGRDPNGIQTQGLRRDETRQDEPRHAPAPGRAPERKPFRDPLLEEIRAAVLQVNGPGMDEPVKP